MKKMFLFSVLCLAACVSKPKATDVSMDLFAAQRVCYQPIEYDDQMIKPDSQGVYHLMNGQLLMKQLKLDEYKGDSVRATITMDLISKAETGGLRGEMFMVANASEINFANIIAGYDLPTVAEDLNNTLGIKSNPMFVPIILMHNFVTPTADETGVAKMVTVFDMTPIFKKYNREDGVWVGLWINAATAEGYVVDAEIAVHS